MDYNKIALEKYIEKNNYPKNWGWGAITRNTNKKFLISYNISETEKEECEKEECEKEECEKEECEKVKKKNKFVNKFKNVVLNQRNDET